MNLQLVLNALANEKRLQILDWLKDPEAHFPPQKDGDLIEDGVCAAFIAAKLEVTAPTLSAHMRLLTDAELVLVKRLKGWTFYKRDEQAITAAKKAIADQV